MLVVDRIQLSDGGLYRGLVMFPGGTYIIRLAVTVLGELIVVRNVPMCLQIVTS